MWQRRPAVVASSDLIDLSELRALFGDDRAEFASLCIEVAEALEKASKELANACRASQWVQARAKAHELKGICGNVGARTFASQCAEFERYAVDRTPEAMALLPSMWDTCRGVCEALKVAGSARR
jgi:HPt (histidine-containing phosphotransfer) domain-containing protein